ncbi:MAG: hypothetical protein Q4G65_16050 [bacterium]|nr:hypothetical protein [bacterium]
MRKSVSFFALAVMWSSAALAEMFSVYTLPTVKGLNASITAQRTGDEWKLAVSAVNTTPTNVVFKLVLAAEPRIAATRYLIPGVLYNGNEFVGKSIPSEDRAVSLDMPSGWQKDGHPWIFAGDRCTIPSCTISENPQEVFALFASDADQKSITSSCSMEKLADGSFRHLIYWPVTEAPVSYTDKRTFSERYDTYLTLAPGETFRADAFACKGTPPWSNYGFAAVFPIAWKNLKHETKAQKTLEETVRLDRVFHAWCHRRNAEGSWFAGGHNDKTFVMGYMNIPKSKEGYTLADYGRDNTLNKWYNNDVETSKTLKPGEYIESAGANDIGFASQSFLKARLAIAYGLEDGNEEDVAFGLEVLRSWIRSRQRPSGLFRRRRPSKPGRTFTDASEVGWAIGELSRTAMLLKANGREGAEFEQSARKVVDVVLKERPGDGGLGSQWDFETGKLINQAGDCGGFVLMGLVRYWQLTRDAEVRKAIDNAFDYYFSRDIDRFECNGGAMDCSSVDREGMQPFLSAAVEMWQATKDERYHERAQKAAWYFLSWVYLQNPVYGPDLDFSVFNWRPAGSTIVGTEHPALDDYGCLVISELIKLARAEKTPLFRDVAALMWRNGTQGFAFEGREMFHALERPIGSKQEAWFPTRWSKYRVGEQKRGSLNDHLMAWGGTYRLTSLLQLDKADRDWLASVSPVETEVTLSNLYGTARIELRGANMRSWRSVGGREVLGTLGIPIYWPWAIREGAPGCEIHGLTPYFDWTVKERGSDRVVLVLEDDESTRRVWPHKFHAEMEYRLGEKLTVEFRVTNTDVGAYSCTDLLHPFFRVSHPKNCRIGGVNGKTYFWKAEADKGADRVWKGAFPIKKIAGGKPGIVFEAGDGAFTLVDGDQRVTATFHGGVKFVTYVAPDGSVSMETGTIYRDRAYVLKPGETHRVGATIQCQTREFE